MIEVRQAQVFLAERRLAVGLLGMGAVSLNRPAIIDHR